jgi:hypothetical protein
MVRQQCIFLIPYAYTQAKDDEYRRKYYQGRSCNEDVFLSIVAILIDRNGEGVQKLCRRLRATSEEVLTTGGGLMYLIDQAAHW